MADCKGPSYTVIGWQTKQVKIVMDKVCKSPERRWMDCSSKLLQKDSAKSFEKKNVSFRSQYFSALSEVRAVSQVCISTKFIEITLKSMMGDLCFFLKSYHMKTEIYACQNNSEM